ncbi:amino acid permease [Gloeocapsopsis sp. IPPAS B-1203]|uniref:APC family permease n=1 Tax=Gloeocapsopsis sp. IPPAS B-1203 TaxID=2049454 RepID=UPI000C187412|nr:amino acid permease [Gloeocapsopsis sp. IPPAS B-1203]PIG94417.1 amino acid permease [Gloeocapsopsis sp. IPPAS B-1203]
MGSSVNTMKSTLLVWDAVALIVGVVIGAGIFETPSLVAGNATNSTMALLMWLLGGGVSIVGALCYAELATTYPHPGGNYYYLQRAFGSSLAFLFAWARLAVIQTGSIVLLAFVFGDYASQLWRLGTYSASIYAAVAIALLTGLNILGVRLGKWTQNWLAAAQILGLILLIFFGLAFATPAAIATAPATTSSGNFGLAMVFVLLTYGGWNEAAYISAELRNVQQNMVRSLLWSIGIITTIYLLVNLAFLRGLGLAGMAESEALAAQLMRQSVGEPGAVFISLLVVVTTLCSTNATIFTGARTNYALGRDFPLFSFLGQWRMRGNTPAAALLVQGAIALLLVLLGTITRNGFETMVDYTAPVFWFFFLLTGVSLFVLRRRDRDVIRPFRVPLYPLIPLLFCVFCAYMLQSSLAYTGVGALVGVAVLLAGVPLLFIARFMRDHNSRRE